MDWHSNSYATETAELGLPKADGRELTSGHREHIDPDIQYIMHEGLDPVEKVLDSDSDHFKVVLYVNRLTALVTPLMSIHSIWLSRINLTLSFSSIQYVMIIQYLCT